MARTPGEAWDYGFAAVWLQLDTVISGSHDCDNCLSERLAVIACSVRVACRTLA